MQGIDDETYKEFFISLAAQMIMAVLSLGC